MVSNLRLEARKNSGDNVFEGIPVGKEEPALFAAFLDAHDFSANSRRAFTQDVRKFAVWFSSANQERFMVGGSRPGTLPTSVTTCAVSKARQSRQSTGRW